MSASASSLSQALDAKADENLLKINSFAIQLVQQQTLDDLHLEHGSECPHHRLD